MRLQPPRGTADLLPDAMAAHRRVIDTARLTAGLFGFEEMATPIFEFSGVFSRPLGAASDIVMKETYSFTDRGGEALTLRPEGTAGVVRALISAGLTQSLPQKFFYHGPMFRYERPQKGRMRQFHQIGVELLGVQSLLADAEVIHSGVLVLDRLGVLGACTLHLNSLGDVESRTAYREALKAYLHGHYADLSADSQRRLETNPLRILDSKDAGDRAIIANAPRFEAYRSAESQAYFDNTCELLTAMGVDFIYDPMLVRGLDYYNHTAFEFITDALGSQGTVLGGGRYDGLAEMLGGPAIAGVGWAAGIDRLALLAGAGERLPPPLMLIALGNEPELRLTAIAASLRVKNIRVEMVHANNLGKQMKRADRLGAEYTAILGTHELARGVLILRNMGDGSQEEIALNNALDALTQKMGTAP